MKHRGHNTDYNNCSITYKLHIEIVDDERTNPFDFWSWGKRSGSALAICLLNIVGTIQSTVVQLLNMYIGTLLVMRGGTKFNFVCGVERSRSTLVLPMKHYEHGTSYSVYLIAFQLHL